MKKKKKNKNKHHLLLSVIISFAPTALAGYIACTRLTDYWHHYSDVIGGSLLGIGCSLLTFVIYYNQFYRNQYYGHVGNPNLGKNLSYASLLGGFDVRIMSPSTGDRSGRGRLGSLSFGDDAIDVATINSTDNSAAMIVPGSSGFVSRRNDNSTHVLMDTNRDMTTALMNTENVV